MSATVDGPDWADVLHRSRRATRRLRTLQAAAVAAVVVAGVASAYALGHPVIDFASAPHAGTRQVNEFGSMEVVAPRGMAPGVLPHQTRRITSVRVDGKVHTLYVAPTKQGGFCFVWTGSGGGCRADRHDRYASRVDAGGVMAAYGLQVLEGSFFQPNGDQLRMTFRDGATADVPFTWVTAPISAGFYLYRIPDAHRTPATRAVSLALYDKDGKLLDREPAPVGRTPFGGVAHVAGFPVLGLPRDGIWSKAVKLFDLRAPNGARIGLWSMPKRGGGTCYVTNSGSGCRPVSLPARFQMEIGFNGDTLCCLVANRIVRVEARFQDGDHISLSPKQGFLVWPIPEAHWPLGHRITALVGYDAAGRAVARSKLAAPADQRGIYPCKKPKDLGYGVKECV
ncbi:MAG TPA: hypothetical protein VGI77_08020 [Gaiellaceae bacterium]|jgi:hypothetical protein